MAKKEAQAKGAAAFDDAIRDKEAEIAAIADELKEAAGDAAKTVAAEKRQRRATAELEALKTAQKAASYVPPEPTDRQEILEGLNKYTESHAARIGKIKESIADADKEAAEIETQLEKAAEDADAAATVKLSNRREELKETKRHLSEMLTRAQGLPVYPDGALLEEWQGICDRLKPEWDNRVMEVRTLATAYRAAADALIQMADTIKGARDDIERRGSGIYCPSYFTPGGNSDPLTVEKAYMTRLHGIYSDVMSGRTI